MSAISSRKLLSAEDLGIPTVEQEFPLVGEIGVQFGRRIYQVMMRFDQLENFLRVFGDVQRKLDSKHVKDIQRYLFDVLDQKRPGGIIPPLVVNARGPITYDVDRHSVIIKGGKNPTYLSINDGQHRVTAIISLLKDMSEELKSLQVKHRGRQKYQNSEEKAERAAKLQTYIERFREMTVSVMIVDNLDEQEEQQAFTDINMNAKNVAKSVSIRYDHSNVYARLAFDVLGDIELPNGVQIAGEKDKLNDNDKEFMLFSTMVSAVKRLIGSRKPIGMNDYNNAKRKAVFFFKQLIESLPQDFADRKKYIVSNSVVIQSIARFANQMSKDETVDWEATVKNLKNVDWKHTYWRTLGLPWDESKQRCVFKGSGAIPVITEGLRNIVEIVHVPGADQKLNA